MGLAVLTGGLAFVGAAEATELVIDGSFENTKPSSSPIVKVGGVPSPGVGGGWSTFSTYLYSTLYTLPGPTNSGRNFCDPTYWIHRDNAEQPDGNASDEPDGHDQAYPGHD